MNDITFYLGYQPESEWISESRAGKSKFIVKSDCQDYLSLSYLFILLVSTYVRHFRKIIDPTRALFKVSKWTIERLPGEFKPRTNFGHSAPNKNINPDINHQSNIIDMDFTTFRVRPMTFSDLARKYKVTRKTVRKRAKRSGIEKGNGNGNFLTADQINLYIQHNGWPKNDSTDEQETST